MQGEIFLTYRPAIRPNIKILLDCMFPDTLKMMKIKFKLWPELSSQPYPLKIFIHFSSSIPSQNTYAHTHIYIHIHTSNHMIMLATRYIFTRASGSPWTTHFHIYTHLYHKHIHINWLTLIYIYIYIYLRMIWKYIFPTIRCVVLMTNCV